MDVTDNTETSLFEMAIWHESHQSVHVVLSGELDLSSAPKLRACLAELASAGVIHIVIDLANVTFIDSTGISLLVTDLKRSSASGGSLVVRNATPQAMRVFQITGLVDLLSVTALEP
jgi:anti-sigma B factor antagonist